MTSLPDDLSPDDDFAAADDGADDGSGAAAGAPLDVVSDDLDNELQEDAVTELVVDEEAEAQPLEAVGDDAAPQPIDVIDEETLLAESAAGEVDAEAEGDDADAEDELEAFVESPYDRPGQWF